MRIKYRLAYHEDEAKAFLKKGIDLDRFEKEGEAYICVRYIRDDDPQWPLIQKIAKKKDCIVLEYTDFTDEEFRAAPYLGFTSQWIDGFPEPSDTHIQWMTASFDLSERCNTCGVGLVQKAPIRINGEPKWTPKKQTRQLFWVEDLMFASRDAYESVFAPFGIEAMPVHSRNCKEYENSVQILPQGVATVKVRKSAVPDRCHKCGRTRYLDQAGGFAPSVSGTDMHFVTSDVWYGTGYASNRDLYVSQELHRALESAGMNCGYCPTLPQ